MNNQVFDMKRILDTSVFDTRENMNSPILQDVIQHFRSYGYIVSDDGLRVSNALLTDAQAIIPPNYLNEHVLITSEGTDLSIHIVPLHRVAEIAETIFTLLPYRLVLPLIQAAPRNYQKPLSRLEEVVRILRLNVNLIEYDHTKGNRVVYRITDNSLGYSWARDRINTDGVTLEDTEPDLMLKIWV